MKIPFNRPYMTGGELACIEEAHRAGHLAGDGRFTKSCHRWLEERTGARVALLTHSCTAALEMSAILCGVGPGDEVIMPSFTFVSTANAFALRGATPVFVDVRPDTLNLDEKLIGEAITPRTRAIVPVHYAGVACAMDEILELAKAHDLLVVEDAAQGITSTYRGRPLGAIGDLGTLSFHETKNIISGEGGALLVNNERFASRAEIIREKGTNRCQFFRGEVDKYTWVDVGSSYLPGEIVAAFLYAQIQQADEITRRRLAIWDTYHEAFADLESAGRIRRPLVPPDCQHNAHMYYLLYPSLAARSHAIARLKEAGIGSVFHYVPLHSSPYGRKYGLTGGSLPNTDRAGECLLRLPLWLGVEEHQQRIVDEVIACAP